MEKIAVGLSGGVDSSVCAYLLKEQGYDVTGVTMLTHTDESYYTDESAYADNTSLASGSACQDAAAVAAYLGIPHIVVDYRDSFKERVIDYFIREYTIGRTPNPCMVCNRYIKWTALIDGAKRVGASLVATGHYSGIDLLPNGRYAIRRSSDLSKDQSYALWGLSQEQLSVTRMPLARYTKSEVRTIAARAGIPVADKPDSQDVCFIPDGDHGRFIEDNSPTPLRGPGDFVDDDGQVLGRHRGIIHYTIGQRKGLNISAGHRVFVSGIDPVTNIVTLSHEDVYSESLTFTDVGYMGIDGFDSHTLTAKIRYNHKGSACRIERIDGRPGYFKAIFDAPVRAITPGQAIVLYTGEHLAAGGIITKEE